MIIALNSVAFYLYAISATIFLSNLLRVIQGRRIVNKHGCKEAKQLPYYAPFQFDIIWKLRAARKVFQLPRLLLDWHDKYGHTFQFTILGGTTYYTRDPANLKAILSTNFDSYGVGARGDLLRPFIGHGASTLDGQGWEHSRAVLRPYFSHRDTYSTVSAEEHVQRLLKRLPENGKEVDLQALFDDLLTDLHMDLMYGIDEKLPPMIVQAERRKFTEAFNYCLSVVLRDVKLSRPLSYFREMVHYRKSLKFCQQYTSNVASKAALPLKTKGFDEFMTSPNEHGNKFTFAEGLAAQIQDKKVIRDQLLQLFFNGRGGMIALLSWTFWCLAREKRVFDTLQREVNISFGRGIPDYSRYHSCTYLEWTLKEVLRLYVPLPINNRCALRDTILPSGGGPDQKSPVLIRKGQTVNFSPFALHRCKDFFGDDALEFKPERWENADTGNNYTYIPFHTGPRACLGQKYALTQMSYIVIRLLQHISSIEPTVTGSHAEANCDVVLNLNPDGCHVRLNVDM